MANVKITDLTALAATDVASNDVLPIVDINVDQTKKIAISDLITATSAANDFITFTQLNANLNVLDANADAIEARRDANVTVMNTADTALQTRLTTNVTAFTAEDVRINANVNVVQDNVAAVEARRVANVTVMNDADTALQARINANSLSAASNDFITFTRLNANINVVQDNVAGLTSTLTIRGDNASDDAVTLGSETLTFKGDTGITTSVASNTVTIDLDDTAVTAGLYGGVSGGVTNVASVTIDATGRITNAANVSVVTNLDVLQDNINALNTQVTANLNTLDSNADAIEARRDANVFFTYNPTGAANVIVNTANLEPSANNTYSLGAPDKVWKDLHVGPGSIFIGANTALKADANGDVTIVQSTDNTPRTLVVDRLEIGTGANKVRLQNNGGRLRQVNRGTPAIADDSASQKDLDNVQSNVTAIEVRRVANVTASTAADTALQARLTTNVTAFSNEDTALQTRITANNTLTTAVETRRTQNIAGAISTITTSDLTASRALVSSGSGKVGVSDVTATELGHLDGVSGAIQTQLDAKAALAGATFTGQVNMSDDLVVTGNLTVNGDTTTANSVNLIVQDRMIMLANSATGAPSADVGFLFNRGNQGNAAFFYDESASTFKLSDTKDPSSNTALSPVTASNLDVGIITAATVDATAIKQNGATLDNLIGSNVDGAISTVNDTDLTASRALVSSSGGKIEVSAVTATEIGHLDGVSGAIQTQIDGLESRRNANTVTATITDDLTITGNSTIGKGFGVGGNTVPAADTISLGTPANVIIRSVGGKGGNVIIGDATATSSHLLDIRGTANTGSLTATAITLGSTNLQSNLEALAGGIAGIGDTFPTGDYGLLDTANIVQDAFAVSIGGLTIFDMKTTPSGSVDTQDLGALS